MDIEMQTQDVLAEVGRMHLYIITLERRLAAANAKIVELTPKPPAPPAA